MAQVARQSAGPVLIVWDHSEIISITKHLSHSEEIPEEWPSERFDVVFVLAPITDGYKFSQVPQQLMHGDTAKQIVGRVSKRRLRDRRKGAAEVGFQSEPRYA